MAREIVIDVSAKINIGLEIDAPRRDGYHPLLSIFQSVGIFDRLRFKPAEAGRVSVRGEFDCPPEKTTVYKASALFLERFRGRAVGGIEVSVEKGIPVMAGMGGGSADAAATLVALDILSGTRLGREELASLACEIGADVPFFLMGGAAVVSGIGEKIEPIPARTDYGLLAVEPGFGVSTKWAYAALDERRRRERGSGLGGGSGRELAEAERLLADPEGEKARLVSTYRKPVSEWDFRNAFREALYAAHPEYSRLEEALREAGAGYVAITGSGSCMYGAFGSEAGAREAEARLGARAAAGAAKGEKTLYGMVLHAIKPLETSLFLR